MNYKLAATLLGDHLKYDTTINEINRIALATFNFQSENFPNQSITSTRAQCVYNWIMTLAKQPLDNNSRNNQLISFCRTLTSSEQHPTIEKILKDCDISISNGLNPLLEAFNHRALHSQIHLHSKKLFLEGNFFHAVFEACKVYNKEIRLKSKTENDGYSLMMTVWDGKTGRLKITPCITETDINVQDGIKFLSAGLMRAVRNPTAHEPAIDWPINKEDCLDLLSFLSFLFRQLDKAVYYSSNPN